MFDVIYNNFTLIFFDFVMFISDFMHNLQLISSGAHLIVDSTDT